MKDEKKHILIVDDDTRICDLLEKFLNKNGYLISTVHNAEQARRLLLGLEFDLIILDVMMPGESGIELTADLRKNTQNQHFSRNLHLYLLETFPAANRFAKNPHFSNVWKTRLDLYPLRKHTPPLFTPIRQAYHESLGTFRQNYRPEQRRHHETLPARI